MFFRSSNLNSSMCTFSVNSNSFRRLRPVVDWQSYFIRSSMFFNMPFDEFLIELMKFKNLTANNFILNQTYTDILLSTHSAVIMICYFRDQYPDIPCPLDRMGSDCCEQYFSKNIQAIGNHPVYPFGQMVRNVGNMNRLSQIQCDFQAPAFARAEAGKCVGVTV